MVTDIIIIAIVLAIIGCAAFYIYKSKKRGDACIGCPHSKQCGKSGCGCGGNENGATDTNIELK